MSQQTSPPEKSFMSLFTQHVYVMQSKTLSDMTNKVFIRYQIALFPVVVNVRVYWTGHCSACQYNRTCSARENVSSNSKNVKIHVFFGFWKKTLKTYVQFQRPLNHPGSLIQNYRKSVPVSHQRQTPLLRNADVVFTFTRKYGTQLRSVCYKCL